MSKIGAILENVYRGPSEDRLIRGIRNTSYLYGRLSISSFEVQSSTTATGEFVALLSARIVSTLDDMVAAWLAPTLPVHDEEGEEA